MEIDKVLPIVKGGAAAELFAALGDGKNVSVFGAPFSDRLLVAGKLGRMLYVVGDVSAAREAYETFRAIDKSAVLLLPRYDVLTYKRMAGGEGDSDRFSALYDMASGGARIAVTTAAALLQRYPDRDRLLGASVTLEKNADYDLPGLTRALAAAGYKREPAVTSPGAYALRGDILDVWGAGAPSAVRAEFFGDTLEDLRLLGDDGKSSGAAERYTVKPFSSVFLSADEAETAIAEISRPASGLEAEFAARRQTVADELTSKLAAAEGGIADETLDVLLPLCRSTTLAGLYRPAHLVFDDAKQVYDNLTAHLSEHASRFKTLLARGEVFPFAAKQLYDADEATEAACPKLAFHAVTTANRFFAPQAVFKLSCSPMPAYARDFELLLSDIKSWRGSYRIFVCAGSAEARNSLEEFFRSHNVGYSNTYDGDLTVLDDYLPHGGILHDFKTVVIGTYDVTVRRAKKALKRTKRGAFTELKEGDYVVHETHGIGLCEGIERLSLGGGERDYIIVAYRDGDKLYLPVENMDSLSKYSAEGTPGLNKLGGAEFTRVKDRVLKSVRVMAIDLARLYAEREAATGRKYSTDMTLDDDFAAAFPYEETDDQLTAIEEGMRDLTSGKIMDRLLCGDVGYGKTEVALRLAFKVIEEGGQVAFVSPTTILARQHFETVKKRLGPFGVRAVSLNRFNTPAETRAALADLKAGKADIVVGTHRVLSKDVVFASLEMLILDEEQRFGVADKEKLKTLRKNVNVLSLSATPIPRTLHMAMSGIRDISVLDTPPAGRLPVQTFVTEFTETLCADAIERELSRGGQVFVVYNRVESIDSFAARLSAVTGGRPVTVAHGQMEEGRLARAIDEFASGKTDVLVSSTIIENGIDLPRANTMIVVDADRLGLSQLYQLRGRVGRSDRLAYVYFTFPEGKQLTETGYKRLEAITQYTELGSGFRIAMADLEIRGAGNVLGREQHGHMDKVGYDMYCKLLARAVAELKGDKIFEKSEVKVVTDHKAFIPDDYVSDSEQRFRAYARIAETDSTEARAKILAELKDVYGTVPGPCENLVTVALVKNLAGALGAVRVTVNKNAGEVVFLKAADMPDSVRVTLKNDPAARLVVADTAKLAWYGVSSAAAMIKFLLNCRKNTAE